ncbi:MAG: isoamylase early set domain-containing protein [bacterium]
MSLSKRYLKSRPVCKVTFKVPQEAVETADSVHIVGDFNEWNYEATPMRKLKNGAYTLTLDLETGTSYQFRYLINKLNWENDWSADEYVYNTFAECENSVVHV